ncbi:unnamed protein product, partial [Urochloa humidicola]
PPVQTTKNFVASARATEKIARGGPSGASGRRGLAGRGGVRGRRPAHPAQAEACVRPVREERATHPAGMDGAKRGAGDRRGREWCRRPTHPTQAEEL